MTRDKGEEDVICAVRTAKGNHSRCHMNQREIDVIKEEEVLPNLSYETDEIGVIAPYNKQVDAVKPHLVRILMSQQSISFREEKRMLSL